MTQPGSIDGVLVQWGDRLFYPSNRRVHASPPNLSDASLHERAQNVRRRVTATVVLRAPQVMVKVTGGGRGMGAITAHLRYISKNGRLSFEDDRGVEREGREALRDLADQWRHSGARIPEISNRREAFNIMLSMPAGTDPETVRRAAREFGKAALANHRYVMVLHTHQANPHVHLSVRASGRDGKRLNPRKEDLHRWRETFAEKLRDRGIEAEATSQVTRGTRHRNERVWERKTTLRRELRATKVEELPRGIHGQALRAWAEIARALSVSSEVSDRKLAHAVNHYLARLPSVQNIARHQAQQRQLPGVSRAPLAVPTQQRRGPELER